LWTGFISKIFGFGYPYLFNKDKRMKPMKQTHRVTEDAYEAIRIKARDIAAESLPLVMTNSAGQGVSVRGAVNFSGIDFKARNQANTWHSSPFRRVDWPWMKSVGNYAWLNPKRFELAIWFKGYHLSGLALGRPTWSGNKLRLDFIEASPEKNALTGLVTDITIIAAVAHATAIGASQIRIMNPINEKVRNHYLSSNRGFSYDKHENFCYKDI
jgi:hypothetical protein